MACTAAPAQVYIHQGGKLTGGHTVAAEQGYSVALSANGNTALFGSPFDNGYNGAAWVFTRDSSGKWSQEGTGLTGSGAVGQGEQGSSVALSADGNTALVGSVYDNSGAGAVWVFTRNSNGVWSQQGHKLVGSGAVGSAQQGRKVIGSGFVLTANGVAQGSSVALSADGNTALEGGPGDNSNIGAMWVFKRNSSGGRRSVSRLFGGALR